MRMLILPYLPSTPFFSTLDFTFAKLIFFQKIIKLFLFQGEQQSSNNNATEQLIVKQEIWKKYKERKKNENVTKIKN